MVNKPIHGMFFVWSLVLAALGPFTLQAAPHSLNLDGTRDRIVMPSPASFNPGAALTIEAWVRPAIGGASCQTIVGKKFTTGYWLGLCNQKIRFYANGNGPGSMVDGIGIVPLGRWTHIAVTFDGSIRKYYINGDLDLQRSTPLPQPVNMASLGIGGEAIGTPSFLGGVTYFEFNGNLSEVRLWDRVRSQTEIRDNLSLQLDGPIAGLIASWHLVSNATDSTGTFVGTPMDGAAFLGPAAPPPFRTQYASQGSWRQRSMGYAMVSMVQASFRSSSMMPLEIHRSGPEWGPR